MPTLVQLPVVDAAWQRFETLLNGRRVGIVIKWNTTIERWSFDVEIDDVAVLHGRRLVYGVDLLKPFAFGIGKLSVFPWSGDATAPSRRGFPTGVSRFYALVDDDT